MADFCHDYEPNGIGCILPMKDNGGEHPDLCFGDFTELVKLHGPTLAPSYEVNLGICEGHGGCVYLVRDDDGSLWFEHGEVMGGKQEGEPESPPRRKVNE